MNIRIVLTTLMTACVLSSYQADAQKYKELTMENPSRVANIYYPYHRLDSVYTDAPKGYKPFYISHYGRHGSRYHTSENKLNGAVVSLQKINQIGLLTDDGKEVLHQCEVLLAAHKGMAGELSPLGAKEHRAIADRMYRHFEKVFNNKNRKEIHCVSSTIPRCLISMANFATQLKEENPSLQFSFTTGQKYFEQYICRRVAYNNWSKDAGVIETEVRHEICHYDKLFNRLFTNSRKAEEILGDAHQFVKELYTCAIICEDLDFLNIDLYHFFDKEELYQQGMASNVRTYGMMGNSKELGKYSSEAALGLVKDFVDKADTALMTGNHTAANLRFGHDTGILPFLNCIGVEGMGKRMPMKEGADKWMAFEMVPMATNFQMIFYQNKKGGILVKMLHNEKETTIEDLPPYEGPYYKWEDLRKYLKGLYE